MAQGFEKGTAQCDTLVLVDLPAGWVFGSAGGSTKDKQEVVSDSGVAQEERPLGTGNSDCAEFS